MKNSINDLTDDEKTLIAFCLMLPDKAFQTWTGEKQITPELYKEICSVSAKFRSPDLMVKICERFPGMETASHLG